LAAFGLDMAKDKVYIPSIALYFGYLVSIITFLFLMFITYTEVNYGWNQLEDVLNIGFSRNIWVAGMSLAIRYSQSERASESERE
jgi:hypothetical protein